MKCDTKYLRQLADSGDYDDPCNDAITWAADEIERLKAIVDPIEELRIDDYIIIHSGTKSGHKVEHEAVEVAADWTNGETEWFHGDTLADALKAAVDAKAERKSS